MGLDSSIEFKQINLECDYLEYDIYLIFYYSKINDDYNHLYYKYFSQRDNYLMTNSTQLYQDLNIKMLYMDILVNTIFVTFPNYSYFSHK